MGCSRCEEKRKQMHQKLLEAYAKNEGYENLEGVSPKALHIFKRKLRIEERNKRIELRNKRKQNKNKENE